MIKKEHIQQLVEEKIAGTGIFLVGVEVKSGNKILIEVDKAPSVSIDDCVQISRHVERNLNRDEEDFELKVSSPGLDKPLRHRRQFEKNVGRKIQVTTSAGPVFKGELKLVGDEGIELEKSKKERVPGKRKKQEVKTINNIPYNKIKEAKIIVSI